MMIFLQGKMFSHREELFPEGNNIPLRESSLGNLGIPMGNG
jgi:hypothetical protein